MITTQNFNVEFIEKELFNVDFVERELLNIELKTIDIIPRKANINELQDVIIINPVTGEILTYENGVWVNRTPASMNFGVFVFNETPNKINNKRFQTLNNFNINTLRVTFNGLIEKSITIIDANHFELPINSITGDEILANYIKA